MLMTRRCVMGYHHGPDRVPTPSITRVHRTHPLVCCTAAPLSGTGSSSHHQFARLLLVSTWHRNHQFVVVSVSLITNKPQIEVYGGFLIINNRLIAPKSLRPLVITVKMSKLSEISRKSSEMSRFIRNVKKIIRNVTVLSEISQFCQNSQPPAVWPKGIN